MKNNQKPKNCLCAELAAQLLTAKTFLCDGVAQALSSLSSSAIDCDSFAMKEYPLLRFTVGEEPAQVN